MHICIFVEIIFQESLEYLTWKDSGCSLENNRIRLEYLKVKDRNLDMKIKKIDIYLGNRGC